MTDNIIYATFDADGFATGFWQSAAYGSKGERIRPVYGATPVPTKDNPHPLPPVVGFEPNPDCIIPADAIEITREVFEDLYDNQGRRKWIDGQIVAYEPPIPQPTPGELQRMFTAAIQAHLDATANHGQYDGIQTAITYRDDPNPRYAAEGLALFNWRSAVWTYATAELDKVTTGQREIPTVDEFIAELPSFDWPESAPA